MSNLDQLKQQCQTLTSQKRHAEALAVAQQMLQMNEQDLGVHKLLALLYGLNGKHTEAHQHYMLLVQFDPTYSFENCVLVAKSYAELGEYKAAGLVCMGALARLKDKRLARMAADCFDRAGEPKLAEKMRQIIS